ncbi:Hypothetical protein PHPALM_17385 [Phytophthora palmivora]|uniref:Uncharacterized protein n=1 Tax=Phytophthora palmivora TaxID=4796 RepID=A0A2P4XMD8_9STRA|nr:Hypothetical protein PHPALM_17385 [Phytophthora palmivora]
MVLTPQQTRNILHQVLDRNPPWTSVQTIAIDKDFLEWRVLENAPSSFIACKEESHELLKYFTTNWKA